MTLFAGRKQRSTRHYDDTPYRCTDVPGAVTVCTGVSVRGDAGGMDQPNFSKPNGPVRTGGHRTGRRAMGLGL